MKTKILILILTLLVLFGTLFAVAAPADLSGTWIGKATIPNGTQDELTLVLKKAKAVYTGTVADSFGMKRKNKASIKPLAKGFWEGPKEPGRLNGASAPTFFAHPRERDV